MSMTELNLTVTYRTRYSPKFGFGTEPLISMSALMCLNLFLKVMMSLYLVVYLAVLQYKVLK